MKSLFRPALFGAALLALAACGSDNKEADQRTAVGEVLPGSTTDAMIRYDQLRSQPPLAPSTGSGGSTKQDADPAAGETATDAAEPDPGAAEVDETAAAPEPAAE